ncbi:MAG: tRNA (adenosine(37)-N6)-threonylcarbamoyltransferase complex ATPase subunit type 1 TsaE, partial [Bacteroidales bacterium]|nr:tRNA (adenosine(37)-N6)-threonylcarbamoyltransferase complex ATPase subunit type 1 TsaE [Bacteroidales bacterium]
INEYLVSGGESVFHFDFFRLKNRNELMDIGYEDYLYSGDYCFIEWPEKYEELLPENCVYIKIKIDYADHSRLISF